MRKTIADLMAELLVARYPEGWASFYDEVMDEFDVHGCRFLTQEYYEWLDDTYAPFGKHRDLYLESAAVVRKSEALSRFFALICRALSDRETVSADLAALDLPKHPTGEPDLAYDMLQGLALCSQIPYCDEGMKKRGIPEQLRHAVICSMAASVDKYMERHGGRPGYHLLVWHQYTLDGRLYVLGRLQYELFSTFKVKAVVYRNAAGESIALADGVTLHRDGFPLGARGYEDAEGSFTPTVTETEDAYVGHPYDGRGYVGREAVTLKKSEWTRAVGYGDTVIGVHIPAGGKLTDEAVADSIEECERFLAKHFPEARPKAYVCGSWMMNPMLSDMLGAESNLGKFSSRFSPMGLRSAGTGIFNFVFLKPDMSFDPTELPENTNLERILKAHTLAGKPFHEYYGYFFTEMTSKNA